MAASHRELREAEKELGSVTEPSLCTGFIVMVVQRHSPVIEKG